MEPLYQSMEVSGLTVEAPSLGWRTSMTMTGKRFARKLNSQTTKTKRSGVRIRPTFPYGAVSIRDL